MCQTVIRDNRKAAELKPMTQMDRLSKRINNERIPLTLYRSARRLNNTGCQDGDGCLPETGDLLVGRKNFLYASSTCGLNGPVRYCAMTSKNTEDYFNQNTKGSCFVCDSTDVFNRTANRYSHRVENIVNGKSMEIDRQGREIFVKWWQSENSKHHVFIQFDLEVEFIFTHVIMIFKSFVPAAMLIEKVFEIAFSLLVRHKENLFFFIFCFKNQKVIRLWTHLEAACLFCAQLSRVIPTRVH
jgi:hypothetical protein